MTLDDNEVAEEKDLAKLDSLVRILDGQRAAPEGMYLINPNTATYDRLIGAGIRKDIARRIIKYRKSGGKFKYREEILKIYGLDKEMYGELEPRLALPDSLAWSARLKKRGVDINKAGISDLIMLTGLDDKLARRVRKYGKLLGGYVSTAQFDEVYGLPADKLILLKRYFYIAKNFVPVKIEINRGSREELAHHPYIPDGLAKDIVKYRQVNGPIADMDELSAFSMVDEERREKLLPYLSFRAPAP
jgi:DNA uptake protein ComE-like DNA-binding protein